MANRDVKSKHHYSGNHSKRFWTRVKNLKDYAAHDSMYTAGVLLQNMEESVLNWLQQLEKRESNKEKV